MKTPPPPPSLEKVRELLKRSAIRLRPPDAWMQHAQSETEGGEDTHPRSSRARHWDCLGALRVEAQAMVGSLRFEGPAQQLYDAAMRRMSNAMVEHLDCRLGSRHAPTAVAHWNDAQERTQDEVLDLFALAASGLIVNARRVPPDPVSQS